MLGNPRIPDGAQRRGYSPMASRYCIVAQPTTDHPPLLKLLRGRLITSHLSLGAKVTAV